MAVRLALTVIQKPPHRMAILYALHLHLQRRCAIAQGAIVQDTVIPLVTVPNVVTPNMPLKNISLLSLILTGKQTLQQRQRIPRRVLLQLLVPENPRLKILRFHAGRLLYLKDSLQESREASLA
jgi:hypothetical protein